jgi:hypothetical protein
MLGVALFKTGDAPAAVRKLHQSLGIFHEVGDYSGTAVALASLAHISRMCGADDVSLYVVGTVHQLRDDMGIGVNTAMDDTIKEFASPESIEELSPDLRARYSKGRADNLDEAVAHIRTWAPGED